MDNLILKFKVKLMSIYLNYQYNKMFSKYKKTKKIYYMSTPSHGNMGDQAIAEVSALFFKNHFPEYKLIEVYREDVVKYAQAIKQSLTKDDLIFIHGGGNMGNLYVWEEETRRYIINNFKKNPIISMTQTITFTNDSEGEKELQKSKAAYNAHPNLSLIAREEVSYNKMKSEFVNANVLINPDIVLYMHNQFEFNKEHRHRVMTCLRSDKESILGEDKIELITYLKSNYTDYFEYDTVIKESVFREQRADKLNQMFEEFKKSSIVITDRLHGMVFCAITKTPCIVTKSLDHKVTGTYEWIKDLNYVRLVDNLEVETIAPLIKELLALETLTTIDLNKEYFSTLRKRLKV